MRSTSVHTGNVQSSGHHHNHTRRAHILHGLQHQVTTHIAILHAVTAQRRAQTSTKPLCNSWHRAVMPIRQAAQQPTTALSTTLRAQHKACPRSVLLECFQICSQAFSTGLACKQVELVLVRLAASSQHKTASEKPPGSH